MKLQSTLKYPWWPKTARASQIDRGIHRPQELSWFLFCSDHFIFRTKISSDFNFHCPRKNLVTDGIYYDLKYKFLSKYPRFTCIFKQRPIPRRKVLKHENMDSRYIFHSVQDALLLRRISVQNERKSDEKKEKEKKIERWFTIQTSKNYSLFIIIREFPSLTLILWL